MVRGILLSLIVAGTLFAEDPAPAPAFPSAGEIQKRAAEFKFEKGQVGGTLHDWIDADLKSWNVALSTDAQTASVLGGLVFQTLFRRDPVTMAWQPLLAAEVPARSEDVDGRVWVVKLREGVTWHDGKPFGADDVVFTFRDVMLNEAFPCPGRAPLQVITRDENGQPVPHNLKVEKVGDHTVRFTLPGLNAFALRLLGSVYILPRHLLEKSVADKSFASAWGITTPPAEIVGTGPFMPSEYRELECVILKRNPHSWETDESGQALPYLDSYEFANLSSPDTRIRRFQDGKLDYLELRPIDVDAFAKAAAQGKCDLVSMGPRPSWSYLAFNQNPRSRADGTTYVPPHKSAWYRDLRFRRAIAHGIDRDRILREVLSGRATALWSPYSPKFPEFYTDDVEKHPLDLAKAGALLDDMALKDTDGDGIREDAKGHPVEFKLMVVKDQPAVQGVATHLVSDLKKLGVSVILVPVEFNAIIHSMSQDWDWDAIYLSYTASSEPLLGKTIWKTGEARRVWNPKADPAAAETRDWERRLDGIFDEAYTHWDPKTATFDRAKDVELAHEWQRICAENLPVIPLFTTTSFYAVNRRLGNVRTSLNSLFDPERLFIRK